MGLLSALIVFSGCSGCENGTVGTEPDTQIEADGGTDIVEEDAEVEVPDAEVPKICEPGAMLGCRTDNTPEINVCNEQGTAIVPGSCDERQICRNGACIDVGCVPTERRCLAGRPQVCLDDAETYQDLEVCEEGFLCDEGFCLDRCATAEVTNSYIGCEYWAVEMENHLLYSGRDGSTVPADRHPPFAVVLANTSDSYDAEITVYAAEGVFAESIPSRRVGTRLQDPGDDPVTVYSEVIDRHGQRIAGPLSGPIDKLILPSRSMMTLILPHREIPFGSSSLTNFGYQVVSSQPVVAYQFNPLCCSYNYTNDASLLLPTSALTENYMFMSHAVWAGGTTRLPEPYSATMTIVAMKPDTEVSIQMRPSSDPFRPYGDIIYPITDTQRVSGPDENGLITLTMQPFEVFNVAGKGRAPVEDLTGARISASEPVAVFGGHTCTNAPFSIAACDHLESQLFPMETWGQSYIAAPLKMRNEEPGVNSREGTYWKFLARQNNTRITTGLDLRRPNVLSPSGEGVRPCEEFSDDPEGGVFTLNEGQTCEFGTRQMFTAQADRTFLLGAFVAGQNTVYNRVDWGDHAGDPSFYLVPPSEQFRNEYSFLTPSTYFVSYVTVTGMVGFPVTLDGENLNLTMFDHEISPDGGTIRAHIPVQPGPHTIRSVVAFGIVVYGYDNYVSYAYTGGLDLKKLSTFE
ncbi:MAG: IgGFc-binding protein [Bradymonadaceae bacterium]